VAMALQRWGEDNFAALADELKSWVGGSPLERRAAVAAVAEPPLLRDRDAARRALELVERITASLAGERDRTEAGVRTLRQALGYCWSVVVAADPERGLPAFERLEASDDPDLQWIVRENRKKARLARLLTR
jgi:hypothetical protein